MFCSKCASLQRFLVSITKYFLKYKHFCPETFQQSMECVGLGICSSLLSLYTIDIFLFPYRGSTAQCLEHRRWSNTCRTLTREASASLHPDDPPCWGSTYPLLLREHACIQHFSPLHLRAFFCSFYLFSISASVLLNLQLHFSFLVCFSKHTNVMFNLAQPLPN